MAQFRNQRVFNHNRKKMASRLFKRGPGKSLNVQPSLVYNQPTVAFSSAPDTSVAPSEYYAIRIDTTTRSAGSGPAKVVLFDSSQLYQLKTGTITPADAVISGVTDNYQAILNSFAHRASYITHLQMTVSDVAKATLQWGHQLEVYESVIGSGPSNVKTVNPRMGVHEGQYQLTINTFNCEMTIGNQTAIVLNVEPGLILEIGFYQAAELGRKQ